MPRRTLVHVVVAETELGRDILGVINGLAPAAVETDKDVVERTQLLCAVGYKL